jgi:hypothetical protein
MTLLLPFPLPRFRVRHTHRGEQFHGKEAWEGDDNGSTDGKQRGKKGRVGFIVEK